MINALDSYEGAERDALGLAFGAMIGACCSSGISLLRMRELMKDLVEKDEIWTLADSVMPGVRQHMDDVVQSTREDIAIAQATQPLPKVSS